MSRTVVAAVIAALASVPLAFFLGRLFFGPRAGLIAAALIACLPIDLGSATHLVPDMPAAFWANLGVLAVLVATRREAVSSKTRMSDLRPRPRTTVPET